MRKRVGFMVALAVVCFGAWAFYQLAAQVSRGGEQTPMYSMRRYDPYGTAAFYRLLSERGVAVETLERPRLDRDAHGVLVQVLPTPEPSVWDWMSQYDVYELPARELADWIAAGNTVIQLTRERTPLMRELRVPEADAQSPQFDAHVREIQAHQRRGEHPDELPGQMIRARPLDDANELVVTLRDPRAFSLEADGERWRPLWLDDTGRAPVAVAGVVNHGEGRLIVIGAPTPMLNDALAEGDNVVVLLEFVGDGPVIFDEWSHGVGHIGTIMELIRQFGLLPALGQLVLIVLVYHWSTRGVRRADHHQPPRRRASIEQVNTLGHLYRQGMALDAVATRVVEEVRHRLAQAWHCPMDRLEERLAHGRDPLDAEAQGLLRRAARVLEHPGGPAPASPGAIRNELAALLGASHELARKRKRE